MKDSNDSNRLASMLEDMRFLAQASAELARLEDYQATLDKIAHLAVPHFADWCTVDMLTEAGALQRVALAHADPAKESIARDLSARFPTDPHHAAAGQWFVLRTGQSQRIEHITPASLE